MLKMDIRGNNSKCLPLIWLENLAAKSFRNNYQATVENLYAQWKRKEFPVASYLSHSFKGAEEGLWTDRNKAAYSAIKLRAIFRFLGHRKQKEWEIINYFKTNLTLIPKQTRRTLQRKMTGQYPSRILVQNVQNKIVTTETSNIFENQYIWPLCWFYLKNTELPLDFKK